MSVTRDHVKAFLGSMTIREMAVLVEELEHTWGVKAATPGSVLVKENNTTPAPVQTEFDVVLVALVGPKIPVIRAVAGVTGLGLRQAKGLVDAVPSVVCKAVSASKAEEVRAAFEEVGATVEVR